VASALAGKVRQITLLNLGRNFALKQEDWPVLCRRLEQLLHPQEALLPLPCTGHIERAAQRYAGQLIVRSPMSDSPAAESQRRCGQAASAGDVRGSRY
jgi:hypothetical protein